MVLSTVSLIDSLSTWLQKYRQPFGSTVSPPPPAPLPTSLQLTATPAPHKHLVFILLQEAREGDPVSDRERFCVGHSCGHCQVYSGKERTEPADDRRVPGQPTAVQQGCSGVSRRPLSHDLIRELSGQGCFNPFNLMICHLQLCPGWDGFLWDGSWRRSAEIPGSDQSPGWSSAGGAAGRGLQVINHTWV